MLIIEDILGRYRKRELKSGDKSQRTNGRSRCRNKIETLGTNASRDDSAANLYTSK
jgi:hypothetical protein